MLCFILIAFISSFLFADNAYAYVKMSTASAVNTFTIKSSAEITLKYYSVYNSTKTQIKTPQVTTYTTSHQILLSDLLEGIVNYTDVKFYVDGVEYTGSSYTVTKDATIEVDLIYDSFSSIYVNLDPITFDGTNHLDTGVLYQTSDTYNTDYDIAFDIVYIDPANKTSGQEQPTIMNAKDEDHNLYPGNVVRLNTRSTDPVQLSGRWNNTRVTKNLTTDGTVIHVVISRRGGVVKGRGYNDTNDTGTFTYYNQANWQLDGFTNNTVTFGARQYNGGYDRYFIGTISNVQVLLH